MHTDCDQDTSCPKLSDLAHGLGANDLVEFNLVGTENRCFYWDAGKRPPLSTCVPLIADKLIVYARDQLAHTVGAKDASYNIANLAGWWGNKNLSDAPGRNCRGCTANRSRGAARRDLEILRAAIQYWHREYWPLLSVPVVIVPPRRGKVPRG